jgi:hypothetical protein
MNEYKCLICLKRCVGVAKDCLCDDCRFDIENEDPVEANGKPYPHYDTRREQEE